MTVDDQLHSNEGLGQQLVLGTPSQATQLARALHTIHTFKDMSSSQSTSHSGSTHPSTHMAVPRSRSEPRRDSGHTDAIHHLYFEDNDPFFPPSWLGKDHLPSERRSSNDSEASHDSKNEKHE